ncbi:hypothetical protein [Schaalia canis]|uniref:PKD domain-containing protein n=1 Tax=Schaalia canis TaxID=100469 RepID=A0A3P1SEE2_9ACTO|nr:hypothetical protein [Schaalia canis]RRC95115.1 hypothetical protein EII11_06865 [Schaalia canis]
MMPSIPLSLLTCLFAPILFTDAPLLFPLDDNKSGDESEISVLGSARSANDRGIVDVVLEREKLRDGAYSAPDLAPGEVQAELGRRALPKNVNLGCSGQINGGIWGDSDICPINFPDESPPEEIPPIDLLYHALSQARIEGAGLQVQPHLRAYVGVPTLVHATQPTRSETLHILGYDVTVSFSASSYKYDFGDGLPPLITTDPSGPYPISRLRHTYQQPFTSQTVALETTWTATVTHPVTGEVLTVPGAMITRERSAPFEVRKARGYLTDTAEELQGR